MPKQKLIYVKEKDFEPGTSTWDGWGIWYEGERGGGDDEVNENPTLTLEEVADFCDQNAEARNNHAYVGTHRILAAVLHRKVGRDQAKRQMPLRTLALKIAGMIGHCLLSRYIVHLSR